MRRTFALLGLALIAASAAEAQSVPAKAASPAPAPARRPRIAHAASPPAEQPQQQQGQPQYAPPIYNQDGYGGYVAAPFVVLSDGSILANFGNGYERVLRACAPVQQSTQANVNGRDALGRILPPPGIAAMQQGSRGQVYGQVPARNVGACYQRDAQGRTEVVRY